MLFLVVTECIMKEVKQTGKIVFNDIFASTWPADWGAQWIPFGPSEKDAFKQLIRSKIFEDLGTQGSWWLLSLTMSPETKVYMEKEGLLWKNRAGRFPKNHPRYSSSESWQYGWVKKEDGEGPIFDLHKSAEGTSFSYQWREATHADFLSLEADRSLEVTNVEDENTQYTFFLALPESKYINHIRESKTLDWFSLFGQTWTQRDKWIPLTTTLEEALRNLRSSTECEMPIEERWGVLVNFVELFVLVIRGMQ